MYTVKRVWFDDTEGMNTGSVDVLAEMEDSSLWMARFVTLPYLEEQMDYGREAGESMPNMPAARYAIIDTQHVIVEKLGRDTIEDVIDNLLALDVFESMFAPVSTEQLTSFMAVSGTAR